MTGKERVLKTLAFQEADRIPLDLWILPAARMRHGEQLDALLEKYEFDIAQIAGPFDHGWTPEYYTPGKYTDPWGSVWTNRQAGIIGEVKDPVLGDIAKLDGYRPPLEAFLKEQKENENKITEAIRIQREKGKFVIGGWISLFERMQFVRGTVDLYCDMGEDEGVFEKIADMVMKFWHIYLDVWLDRDIDAVAFGDDWGSQRGPLVSPVFFREQFKPRYKELIDRIKGSGKKVFFHSDGYIFDLYGDFIELGVDAMNSQLWCMGVEKVAEKYAGKLTFWGEISRQNILPSGTPEEIRNAAEKMKKHLRVSGGGLIGQSEINRDVPLENVEAFLNAWN
jgi:uroporphyrinogen decarboxylase